MFDDTEPTIKNPREIILDCDLSTFSLEDIDERVTLLEAEIVRLKQEKTNKSASLNAAEAFFKT